MPLKPTKVRKIVKALTKLGFTLERIHGSHLVFKHADGRITVVPRHGNEEIGRGLLRKIALDLRMSSEEFSQMVDSD
ncbi:MAG: type II toxin-antitoxin system HicA family toxin [Nitrososphaerales archaeon]